MLSVNVSSKDLLVMSHLRWNFVYQRPQHLMERFAKYRRVFFLEPPLPYDRPYASLVEARRQEGLRVLIPYLPETYHEEERESAVKELFEQMLQDYEISNFTAWYYFPKSLKCTAHLKADLIIYDCMDELTGFKDSPSDLKHWENELMQKAHVVFTGGNSLFKAKRDLHFNIHSFPSSIDQAHFKQARLPQEEPLDQAQIPHPRIGFYGVIEERIDLELLAQLADLRPDYQFIMVGPVIRMEESLLPRRANIHYLGKKDYQELPKYLAGWDAAMMPFALNEATRYISPTKTPEFLAAGKTVVSTAINDVVHPYANPAELVRIAHSPAEFALAVDQALKEAQNLEEWLPRVDEFLKDNSWDMTFAKMAELEMLAAMEDLEGSSFIVQDIVNIEPLN